MNLPNGEMLLLTIDRVVDDVECSRCKGAGKRKEYVLCDQCELHCSACHGTGRRKARVRGCVEVGCSHDIHETEWFSLLNGGTAWMFIYRDEFYKRIIAAWRDDALPLGTVANITEEEVPDDR